MPNIVRIWRHRGRVAEAMVLLLAARMLVARVPLRYWRSTLGKPGAAREHVDTWPYVLIARAVNRGAARLPGQYVCLPRAMAVQWMLRRRGRPSALVFGVERSAQRVGAAPSLHAWVEAGQRTIIGADSERSFARGLVLVQP